LTSPPDQIASSCWRCAAQKSNHIPDGTARVAALEKEKATADNAVKQAEQARSDAEKSWREAENESRESANAKANWWWAYVLIAGLIGVMVGLAAFPFIKRRRQSSTS
jgi:hypothetical protein